MILALGLMTAMIIGALLYALLAPDTGIWMRDFQPGRELQSRIVFDNWIDKNIGRFQPKPEKLQPIIITDLWVQDFALGSILYDLGSSNVFVVRASNEYFVVEKPAINITHGPEFALNEALFASFTTNYSSELRETYLRLLNTDLPQRAIKGGIGTVYIKENLLGLLGEPIGIHEYLLKDALVFEYVGQVALVLGAPANLEFSPNEPRKVYFFRNDGQVSISTEFPGDYPKNGAFKYVLWGYALTAAKYGSLPIILLAWAFLSTRFARTFSKLPVLSLPLELDSYVRNRRSILVSAYLAELEHNLLNEFDRKKIVVAKIPFATRDGTPIHITDWSEHVCKAVVKCDPIRARIVGSGGTGKTVLSQHLTHISISFGVTPFLLSGSEYRSHSTLLEWIGTVLDRRYVHLRTEIVRSLPNTLIVIDQVSEVPVEHRDNFCQMLRSELGTNGTAMNLCLFGRLDSWLLDTPFADAGAYNHALEPHVLGDEDLRNLVVAYMGIPRNSQRTSEIVSEVRLLAPQPTVFLASQYIKSRKSSVRSVQTTNELYEEIFDSCIRDGEFSTSADITRRLIGGLVARNYGKTGSRGLPSKTQIMDQVLDICNQGQFAAIYGTDNVPNPAEFTSRLLASSLISPGRISNLFFHDTFEDWILEEIDEKRWIDSGIAKKPAWLETIETTT